MFYPDAVWKKKIHKLMLNKCLWLLKKIKTVSGDINIIYHYTTVINSLILSFRLSYGKVPVTKNPQNYCTWKTQ